MSKKNVFFIITCLFLVKCIILPVGFADAIIALGIISYNLFNKLIEIKKNEKIAEKEQEEINKVREELNQIKGTMESIKVKEQFAQSLGFGQPKQR